jgi:hypothetical protein
MMNLTEKLHYTDRAVTEEHTISEKRGMLGGRSLETTAEGKLQRTIFATTCESCGLFPLDHFVMCVSCRKRLCSDCASKLNGMPYCRPHLIEIFPLSRNGYKVLTCIEAGVDDLGEIRAVTRVSKDDVKASLAFLLEQKLISQSGLLTFLQRKATADGLHALSVYRNVYGKEEDVKAVEQQLKGEDEEANADKVNGKNNGR